MQPYTYSVTLRLQHPSEDPAKFTRLLAMEPGRCWKAGEARKTPTGTPLAGTYANTYWYASLVPNTDATDERLERVLDSLLDSLMPLQEVFTNIIAEGGSAEFYIGLHGPGSFGFTFQPTLLKRCGGIGLALSLEVYPVHQRG